MAVIKDMLEEVTGIAGRYAENVAVGFDERKLDSITDDIFSVVTVKKINGGHVYPTQSLDVIPLDITFGVSIYSKPETPYADVLEYAETVVLRPFGEISFNTASASFSDMAFDQKTRRNLIKIEICVTCNYITSA